MNAATTVPYPLTSAVAMGQAEAAELVTVTRFVDEGFLCPIPLPTGSRGPHIRGDREPPDRALY